MKHTLYIASDEMSGGLYALVICNDVSVGRPFLVAHLRDIECMLHMSAFSSANNSASYSSNGTLSDPRSTNAFLAPKCIDLTIVFDHSLIDLAFEMVEVERPKYPTIYQNSVRLTGRFQSHEFASTDFNETGA